MNISTIYRHCTGLYKQMVFSTWLTVCGSIILIDIFTVHSLSAFGSIVYVAILELSGSDDLTSVRGHTKGTHWIT